MWRPFSLGSGRQSAAKSKPQSATKPKPQSPAKPKSQPQVRKDSHQVGCVRQCQLIATKGTLLACSVRIHDESQFELIGQLHESGPADDPDIRKQVGTEFIAAAQPCIAVFAG